MKTEQARTPRPRLSVAIIVRNEQDVIAETLDSIRLIADEIVVWDSGSDDETTAIARKKGAKVFQGFWRNNFSLARNACMEKVTGNWILWLDAGEKLVGSSATKLREFIDSSADIGKVYQLMVEIPPAENCATGEQIALPRLIPAKAGLKFKGRVRETLYPSIQSANLSIELAPGRILRHPRQHANARKNRISRRDLDLLELELIDNQYPDARIFLGQGEAHVNLGNYERARESFIKAIELSQPGSTDMLEGYYGLLTGYNNDHSLHDAQMRVCLNALEIFPLDAQLLLAMGSYFQTRNCLDLAVRAFETAVTFGQINTSTWHLCELHEIAASCCSMAFQLLGKDDEACKTLESALEKHPQSARLQRLSIDLYIKNGNPDQAIKMARQTGIVTDANDPEVLVIRGACKAAKQEWTPALAYLQSAYLMGCHTPLCLRWLAVTLLSNGQGEAAKPVLAEWKKLEPTNAELLAYLSAVQETPQIQNAPLDEPVKEENTTVRQYRLDSGNSITELKPIKIPAVNLSKSSEHV